MKIIKSALLVYLFLTSFSFCVVNAGPNESLDLTQSLKDSLGNKAQSVDVISLDSSEILRVKNKQYKAALVWHGASNWVNALSRGAHETFEKLGIIVVAETDAQFDAARQANDIENVMALKPDIILTLVIDGVSAKKSLQLANKENTQLVLLSNPIPGFKPNKEYVGIVTDDMHGMGVAAAKLMSKAVKGSGKIGMIYHDVDYFITNNRDNAFRSAIKQKLSGLEGLEIVTEKGFAKENDTFNVVSAMVLQHPELKGIYVAWDAAAEGVVEGLRAVGRSDIKVITHDLGLNNLVDMAKQGSMYGTISDRPYEIGEAMAQLAVYGLLDKEAPPFTVVGFDEVTRKKIRTVWTSAYHSKLPAILEKVLSSIQ